MSILLITSTTGFCDLRSITRQLFIDWRQAFFCVDNEKEKIALAQRFFGGAAVPARSVRIRLRRKFRRYPKV